MSLMSCPKNVLSIQANGFVMAVILFGNFKGLHARVHDEDDHSECEDVRHDGLVLVAQKNFRRHVTFRADSITPFTQAPILKSGEWTGHSKVDNPEIEV